MDRTPRPYVSVKFSAVGRSQSFLLPEFALDDPPAPGEQVVVQGDQGHALGTVASLAPPLTARREPSDGADRKVLRRATREDVTLRLKQQRREQDAFRVCLMKIRERGMPMKLTRVEQLFDGSRLVFYYTADGRVDFRDLVRELAAHFRCRIEMRQIGVRDEAKLLGGYGPCGRPLCCTTWLNGFAPVSIRMAKQQQLSLNPSKLSGQCGRLKCCLRYELPNGKGVTRGGCADEGSCGQGGCGLSGCSSGGCGSCRGR